MSLLAACPAPHGPAPGSTAGRVLEVGRSGRVLAGVAVRGATVYASLGAARSSSASSALPAAAAAASASASATSAAAAAASSALPTASSASSTSALTTIDAFAPGATAAQPSWRADLAGFGGPLAVSGARVVAALGGTGNVAGLALRGEPGAALAALDATTGAAGWTLAIDATEWAAISALTATSDGVLVCGSFSGTLRIADRVVSSAGRSDGFVARVTAAGGVAWLVRMGGPGADSIAGVAAAGDRIAIAGTYAAGAELLGQPLPAFDERSPHVDGFVAELDGAGAWRWTQTFGGKADEAIAGVTIDAAGRIAVAATVRETVHIGGVELVARGPADGLVAWWPAGGGGAGAGTTILLGGSELDGLRAITSVGDHVVVAGFYSGTIQLGDRTLTAAGGDDAFLAELDPAGTVARAWPVSGDGREEITALAALPGGFVAGVAHTAAARVGDDRLPSPADPMSGAAVVQRALR